MLPRLAQLTPSTLSPGTLTPAPSPPVPLKVRAAKRSICWQL